jgi:hypothetical protein
MCTSSPVSYIALFYFLPPPSSRRVFPRCHLALSGRAHDVRQATSSPAVFPRAALPSLSLDGPRSRPGLAPSHSPPSSRLSGLGLCCSQVPVSEQTTSLLLFFVCSILAPAKYFGTLSVLSSLSLLSPTLASFRCGSLAAQQVCPSDLLRIGFRSRASASSPAVRCFAQAPRSDKAEYFKPSLLMSPATPSSAGGCYPVSPARPCQPIPTLSSMIPAHRLLGSRAKKILAHPPVLDLTDVSQVCSRKIRLSSYRCSEPDPVEP